MAFALVVLWLNAPSQILELYPEMELALGCSQGVPMGIDWDLSWLDVVGFTGDRTTLWIDHARENLPAIKPSGTVYIDGNCINGQPGTAGYSFSLSTIDDAPITHVPEFLPMVHDPCTTDGWCWLPYVDVNLNAALHVRSAAFSMVEGVESGEFLGDWTWNSLGDVKVDGILSAFSDTFDHEETFTANGRMEVDPVTEGITILFRDLDLRFQDPTDPARSVAIRGDVVLKSLE